MSPNLKTLILGAGNFGTCLAQYLANLHPQTEIILWDIDHEVVEGISQNHKNPKYLSEIDLHPSIRATNDLNSLNFAEIGAIVLVIPTQFLRSCLLEQLKEKINKTHLLICASKGVEISSLKLPLEIIEDVLGKDISKQTTIISGPSFAIEVAQKIPTAVACAGTNPNAVLATQKLFHSPVFRVYSSEDPTGLEIAGALKNVIAIASGACMGLGFQNNSRAALITRGLAEITRFGVALGAKALTFSGLGGVGDLFLTCSSEKSRNFRVGFKLGEGKSLETTLTEIGSTAEGVATAKAAYLLSQKLKIKAPITREVYLVLYENKSIRAAVQDLITREAKPEFG